VVGLSNPGLFVIGDTVCTGEAVRFTAIPRFPPECFASLQNRDMAKYKQFDKGLAQLEEEGAILVLYPEDGSRREPILGAVGDLQFDVVQARLKTEYGVETAIQRLHFTAARWVRFGPGADPRQRLRVSSSTRQTRDREDRLVLICGSTWEIDYCRENNPGVELLEIG